MWTNGLAIAMVAGAAVYAGYRLIRRPASGCGCGGCSSGQKDIASPPKGEGKGCCSGKSGQCTCGK